MSITSNSCGDDHRLAVLEASGTGGVPALNGIEYVDVGADQQTLTVHLVHEVPKGLTEANVRIDGGRRITGIRVLPFQIAEHHRGARASSQFTIKTDRAGDFSPYVLRLVDADSSGRPGTTPLAGFDRFYGAVEFDFKVDCPTGLDCAGPFVPPGRATGAGDRLPDQGLRWIPPVDVRPDGPHDPRLDRAARSG